MAKLLESVKWGMLDCVSGAFTMVETFPFKVGSGKEVQLDLGGDGDSLDLELIRTSSGISLTSRSREKDLVVNGEQVHFVELKPMKDYSVKLGSHFFAIRGQRKVQAWPGSVDVKQWSLLDSMTEATDGPLPPGELIKVAREKERHRRSNVRPHGLESGFLLFHLWDELEEKEPAEVEDNTREATVFIGEDGSLVPVFLEDEEEQKVADSPDAHARLSADAKGRFLCPHCWGRFDEGDILHIAVHEGLRGDPILGPAEMRRFLPMRFDDDGLALDGQGLPCLEMACPHCRLRLPRDFIRIPHKSFSLVGDVGSGKTTLLAAMSHFLPMSLKGKGVRFHGQDRYRNRDIKELSTALYSGESDQPVELVSTTVDGAHYQAVSKAGRRLRLPQPFIFRAEKIGGSEEASLVIYDPAGDDYVHESGDSAELSEHVAHADGIVFLVDPLRCGGIRKKLGLKPPGGDMGDDRHGSMLDSVRQRIQRKKRRGDTTDVPMAVVLQHSDLWRGAVSGDLKEWLAGVEPELISALETTSSRLAFFGCSLVGYDPPERIDPAKVKPDGVAAPFEWLMQQGGMSWISEGGEA